MMWPPQSCAWHKGVFLEKEGRPYGHARHMLCECSALRGYVCRAETHAILTAVRSMAQEVAFFVIAQVLSKRPTASRRVTSIEVAGMLTLKSSCYQA
eukprot:6204238-Amphidinium_carterae.1